MYGDYAKSVSMPLFTVTLLMFKPESQPQHTGIIRPNYTSDSESNSAASTSRRKECNSLTTAAATCVLSWQQQLRSQSDVPQLDLNI